MITTILIVALVILLFIAAALSVIVERFPKFFAVLIICCVVLPLIVFLRKKIKELKDLDKPDQPPAAPVEPPQKPGTKPAPAPQAAEPVEKEQPEIKREYTVADAIERDRLLREHFVETLDSLPEYEITVADKPAPKLSVSVCGDIECGRFPTPKKRAGLGDFVVFDTETTGFKPTVAEVVEIAAIRFRGWQPVEKFSTLCRPKNGINEEAAAVNGITEDMVEGKPLFGQVAASFRDFIGEDALVAHNLPFDIKFIVKGGVDVFDVDRRFYDTLTIAQSTIHKQRMVWDEELGCKMPDERDVGILNYKLPTLCRWYGIPRVDSHRALADCYETGLLFAKLAEERLGELPE